MSYTSSAVIGNFIEFTDAKGSSKQIHLCEMHIRQIVCGASVGLELKDNVTSIRLTPEDLTTLSLTKASLEVTKAAAECASGGGGGGGTAVNYDTVEIIEATSADSPLTFAANTIHELQYHVFGDGGTVDIGGQTHSLTDGDSRKITVSTFINSATTFTIPAGVTVKITTIK